MFTTKLYLDDQLGHFTSLSVAEVFNPETPLVSQVHIEPIPLGADLITYWDWSFLSAVNMPIGYYYIQNLKSTGYLVTALTSDPLQDAVVQCVQKQNIDERGIWKYDPQTGLITQSIRDQKFQLSWRSDPDEPRLFVQHVQSGMVTYAHSWVYLPLMYRSLANNTLYYETNLIPQLPPGMDNVSYANQLDGAVVSLEFLNVGPCVKDITSPQIMLTESSPPATLSWEEGWANFKTSRIFKLQQISGKPNFFYIYSTLMANTIAQAQPDLTGKLLIRFVPDSPFNLNQLNSQFLFSPVVDEKTKTPLTLNGRFYNNISLINKGLWRIDMDGPLPAVSIDANSTSGCSAIEIHVHQLSGFTAGLNYILTGDNLVQCCIQSKGTDFPGTLQQFQNVCVSLNSLGTTNTCDQYMEGFCERKPADTACNCINASTIIPGISAICTDAKCAVGGYRTSTMLAQLGDQTCGYQMCTAGMAAAHSKIYLPDGTSLDCTNAPQFKGGGGGGGGGGGDNGALTITAIVLISVVGAILIAVIARQLYRGYVSTRYPLPTQYTVSPASY